MPHLFTVKVKSKHTICAIIRPWWSLIRRRGSFIPQSKLVPIRRPRQDRRLGEPRACSVAAGDRTYSISRLQVWWANHYTLSYPPITRFPTRLSIRAAIIITQRSLLHTEKYKWRSKGIQAANEQCNLCYRCFKNEQCILCYTGASKMLNEPTIF